MSCIGMEIIFKLTQLLRPPAARHKSILGHLIMATSVQQPDNVKVTPVPVDTCDGRQSTVGAEHSACVSDHQIGFDSLFTAGDDPKASLQELPFHDEFSDDLCYAEIRSKSCSIKDFRKEKKKKKRSRQMTDTSADGHRGRDKKYRAVPNYFVACKIANLAVLESIERYQDSVLAKDPRFTPTRISARSMHFTIVVCRLDSDDDFIRAKTAMDSCKTAIGAAGIQFPLALHIYSLGHFNKKVLFGDLAPDDSLVKLKKMASIVHESFIANDICITDARFKPHLTLFKMSKAPQLRREGLKCFPDEFLSEYKNLDFGVDSFDEIQLLAMQGPKTESGYYKSVYDVKFEHFKE